MSELSKHPTPEEIKYKLIFDIPTPVQEVVNYYSTVLAELNAAEGKLKEIEELVGSIELNEPTESIQDSTDI